MIDVEGARADSAQLCARPLELDVQFRSADGKHSFSVELAHAIDPEQSRAQVRARAAPIDRAMAGPAVRDAKAAPVCARPLRAAL